MKVKNLSTKQILLSSIALIIALFNLLTLLFTIVKMQVSAFGTQAETSVNGFSVIAEYPAAIENIGGWLSVYSILHLIASLIILAILCSGFFKMEWIDFATSIKTTNIICCVMSLVYMINGISASAEAKSIGQGFYKITSGAFVPFILIAILIIAFFAVKYLMEDNFAFNLPRTVETKANVEDVASELEKYKALLDKNIITEEEFEAKRKQLLGL